jgi:hypothetical protein
MCFAKHHQHHRGLKQCFLCDYIRVFDIPSRVFQTPDFAFSGLIVPE